MPELPEVEVVRRGLADHVVGRTICAAAFPGRRVARTHPGGSAGLAAELAGQQILSAERRGKFLWMPLSGGRALSVHLRMSGQLLVCAADAPLVPHTHARLWLSDDCELRFVDQRTFGLMTTDTLVCDPHAATDPAVPTALIPDSIRHIAPDPFEAAFDAIAVARRMRRRDVEIKRQLLDQHVVSGIGNIYADEALWEVGVHGRRRGPQLRLRDHVALLGAAAAVMERALAAGGTSFDSLYVDVNGASGYFSRSLHAYGRLDEPCLRCGTAMGKETIGGRGSYFCPHCQPPPRRRRA